MGDAGCGWIAYCDKEKKAILKEIAKCPAPRLRRDTLTCLPCTHACHADFEVGAADSPDP